jgi:hypothetical protein
MIPFGGKICKASGHRREGENYPWPLADWIEKELSYEMVRQLPMRVLNSDETKFVS